MTITQDYTAAQLSQAKEMIVKKYGQGGQARALMISVENIERGDYVRGVDRQIVDELLKET